MKFLKLNLSMLVWVANPTIQSFAELL